LICKKTPATAPYTEVKPDDTFRQEVFGDDHHYIKRPDDGSTKLGECPKTKMNQFTETIKKTLNNLLFL
jgi:hypothetical protein